MRPSSGELRLAASSVRIARRRLRDYHDGEKTIFELDDIVPRLDALLRRAEELLGSEDIRPSI